MFIQFHISDEIIEDKVNKKKGKSFIKPGILIQS